MLYSTDHYSITTNITTIRLLILEDNFVNIEANANIHKLYA